MDKMLTAKLRYRDMHTLTKQSCGYAVTTREEGLPFCEASEESLTVEHSTQNYVILNAEY